MIPKKLLLNPQWKEIFEEYNLKKKIEKLDRNFRFSINWITIASFRLKKRLRILVGILLEIPKVLSRKFNIYTEILRILFKKLRFPLGNTKFH